MTGDDEGTELPPVAKEGVRERYDGVAATEVVEEGAGLGLAIVDELVGRWGGRVRLSNRPEGGLRAEVLVPTERATS